MSNPYEQFINPDAPQTGGNPYAAFIHAPTVDEQEQDIISRVKNPRVESPRNFGFVEVPATIANEFNRSILQIPKEVGVAVMETGELAQTQAGESVAETARDSFIRRFVANQAEGDTGLGGLIQTIWGTEKDIILSALPEEVAPALVSAGKALIEQNDAATNFLLGAPKQGIPADIGAGFGSLMRSIGAWYVGGSKAAGALMGVAINSSAYQEARKKLEPEDAAAVALSDAVIQGKLESLGTGVYTAILHGSSFFKKVLFRAAEQGVEESAQQIAEETIMDVGGVRDLTFAEKLHNILYSGALGLVVGAPTSVVFTKMEDVSRGYGIDPKEIKGQIEAFIKNKDQVIDAAADVINKEASGITKDDNARASALNDMKGALTEQEAVNTAISEGTTQDPAIAAKVLLQSPDTTAEVRAAIEALPKGFTMEQLQEAAGQPALETGTSSTGAPSAISANVTQVSGVQAEPSQATTLPEPSGIFSSAAMTPSTLTGPTTNSSIRETPSGSIIYQKSDNANDLMAISEDLKPKLNQYLAALSRDIPGVKLLKVRAKPADSVRSKLESGKRASQISDYLGARFAANTRKDMQLLLARIGNDAKILQSDDFLNNPRPFGYRALHLQVATTDGFTYEIQILPKPIAEVYDKARNIYEKWRRKSVSKEEMVEFLNDKKKAEALFDKAWSKFNKGDKRGDTYQRLLDAEKDANRFSVDGGKEFLSDVTAALSKAMTPISTRLRNINPKLSARLREFEFDHNKQINADSAIAKPFLEKFHKLSREDRTIMDFAMKNGDMETINEIAAANNMTAEIEALRVMFDNLYKRGKKVNLDIGYRKGFFPRLVENPKKLLAYFGKTEAWNDIQQAIKNKEGELGKPLTDDEKAHLINTLLRGYQTAGITLAKPGALKERSIDQVTPEINQFYATTDQAILHYITTVNDAIETRNFLGKDAETMEDSIGAFVLRELEKGTLNPNQAQELSEILKARFHQGKMNPLLKAYKNLSYIDTMGSPISAITQLGGISYSLSNNGFYRVLKSLPGAVTDTSELTLQDIGVDRIAEEFSDGGTTGNAVRKVFKLSGLQKLDRMDKLTFINSTLLKFRDLAKKPTKEFKASLENIFEEETDSVIADLQNGVNSENVKLLVWNEILDIQPIAKSEMPELYLSNPNGRIFYMLKSFTLKQYDIYRKQVFEEIRAGNKVKGLKNLTRLVAFFVMMNAGADFLKDLLLNRETEPEDQVVTNIARVFGFSKYQVYSVKREGVGTAAFKTIAPPFKAIDSMSKDMAKAIDEGEVDVNDLETIQSVPIAGKFYYWWFGAGSDK